MRWIGREAMAREVGIGIELVKDWCDELGLACEGL